MGHHGTDSIARHCFESAKGPNGQRKEHFMSDLKDKAKDKIDAAADAAKKASDKVADKAKDVAHSAGEKMATGAKALKNA
jgi:hypothetical protein